MGRFDSRRDRFRELLSGDQCFFPASVHDPVSARIAHDLGFEVGMFAGSVASLAVLGAPDLIVVTLTEFAEQARRIGRASELPIMVDADHGYGNALNVMRTVEELDTAGVAGLSIEDTALPAAYGEDKPRLLSIDEGLGKMQAAVQARGADGPVIAGRTSAPSITGIDDTIARVQAYEKTGVDAIFVVGIKTRDALDAVANVVSKPIILGGAGKSLMDKPYLASRGVRLCLQGHQPFAAATEALYRTLKYLRDGGDPSEAANLASTELTRAVSRSDDYAAWSKKFLG